MLYIGFALYVFYKLLYAIYKLFISYVFANFENNLGSGCGSFPAAVATARIQAVFAAGPIAKPPAAGRMDLGCFRCGAVILKLTKTVLFSTKYHFYRI